VRSTDEGVREETHLNSMGIRQSSPIGRQPRFWIGLPAIILIVADATATFAFQSSSYWAGSFADRIETSPLGAAIFGRHPALFGGFILIWALVIIVLLAWLPRPLNKVLALAVVVGHTAGIYGWLVLKNYWYAIPVFLLVGILTVACWQKADSASTLSS
jgi:hypothetical protein